MTEEEARPDNTQPGASQPDKKPEGKKSLTDKNSDLIAGTLRFIQTKEQKTMVEQPKSPQTPKTPGDAQKEFVRIKEALIGPNPEWCLPTINPKAQASSPRISALIAICPAISTECPQVGVE
jgi:hypothetical protein